MRSSQPRVRWPRRWPVHPRPGALESLSSWLQRLAGVYGMSVRVWAATGLPERGGLSVWRVYEHLDWDTQEALLHAAATALQLAADGRITACGRLASAIQPPPGQHVYDGDRHAPQATAWQDAVAQAEAATLAACTDRDTAQQLLAWSTIGCRTLARFEAERGHLVGIGIPAGFLPSASELGRTDLL